MITLIQIHDGGYEQHLIVETGTDDMKAAEAKVRKLVKDYHKEEPDNMSLGEYIDERFSEETGEVNYFPIHVDVLDEGTRVNGTVVK